jgi:hypothetical protein
MYINDQRDVSLLVPEYHGLYRLEEFETSVTCLRFIWSSFYKEPHQHHSTEHKYSVSKMQNFIQYRKWYCILYNFLCPLTEESKCY